MSTTGPVGAHSVSRSFGGGEVSGDGGEDIDGDVGEAGEAGAADYAVKCAEEEDV